MGKSKELTNQRFGKLIAIKIVSIHPKKGNTWECQCDCGKITNVLASNLGKATNSCSSRCLKTLPNNEAAFNSLFKSYEDNARRDSRNFTVSKKFFRKLTKMNCHYCGKPPEKIYRASRNKTSKYKYNGIDRINNDKGYIKGNCRSCCSRCNFAKHKMREQEFKEHIQKIYNHWANK